MQNEPEGLFNLKFLQVICQLHEWENQHLEVTSTQAGRYLYLNIARQLQEQRGGVQRFFKRHLLQQRFKREGLALQNSRV